MKIIRNGNEIELTWAEMREVYEFMKRDYLKEDIAAKAEEMEIELTDKEIDSVADIAQSGLEHNDSYWESYWMTIEYAIMDTKTITRSMVANGYKKGVIYLMSSPNDDCIAACIGDNWFYFAGMENETMTPEEYKAEYTVDEIVYSIYSVLDSDFKTEFEDEYLYYYYYLKECGC